MSVELPLGNFDGGQFTFIYDGYFSRRSAFMTFSSRLAGATLLVAMAIWLPANACGNIVVQTIDDFGDNQYQSAAGANGVSSEGIVGVTSGLVAGTGRSVYVQKTSGSSNVFLRIEALDDAGESAFSVSRGSGIGGHVLVQWDGESGPDPGASPVAFDPTSNLKHLLNLDLTGGGAEGVFVRVLNADLAGQELRITLFGADSSVASEQVVSLPAVVAPGSFDALFPFAGFTLRSGASSMANLAAVQAFTLQITGPNGSDLTLDMIGTYAVPEPATASVFAVGMWGVLHRARRQRRGAVGGTV